MLDTNMRREEALRKNVRSKKALHMPGGANEKLEVPGDPKQTNSGGADERALRKTD